MQERLFRESAERMRTRCTVEVANFDALPGDKPLPDIHKHYPDHWTWRDPYARLGLPRQSSAAQVKSHYRKLALLYHPDKRKYNDAAARFHAITAAYRKLTP